MQGFYKFKKRILFIGIPDMAYVCLDGLKMLGVNIVGVVGPKKDHPTFNVFKNFTSSRGFELIEFDDLSDVNFINKIKELNADIAVVCSFNYKIPKCLLDAVKDGFINVHPSLLPKYRGPNPYSSVLINNEKETGVTLHFMDEAFDTGDIIEQKTIEISDFDTMGTLFNRTNIVALEMLISVLAKYDTSGTLPRRKQIEGNFPSAPNPKESDILIDYSNSAEKISRIIRALNPFIIAKTVFRKSPVSVMSADFFENDNEFNHAKNGEIVKIERDKFYIKTKKGLLCPTVLQFGSFFIGTASDFVKILGPKIGESFE